MSTTITIKYLGCGHDAPAAAPITIEYPAALPAGITVGWADRSDSSDHRTGRPPVYAEIDGISAAVDDKGLRVQKRFATGLYPFLDAAGKVPLTADNAPEWVSHLPAIRRQVVAAIAADRAARPEVERACAAYEAILAGIRREYDDLERMWSQVWLPQIARAFRRRTVSVGEETVPGLRVVRGARGTTLGYAKCWDGRYLGETMRA